MRFAIVGGGMLGSTIALDLAEAGFEVTLFERANELGGLASAWTVGDVTWDRHYHVTLASDRHTRGLLGRLGLESEIRWVTTHTGTWSGGELHSMSSTLDYLRYPELGLVDKLRLAWTILSANRIEDWKALEKASVEEWLRHRSGDRVFESFWLPLLRAKLGDAYQETSAAYIWATIRRLYAARSQGLKREMFGYVPGGYARTLSVLADALIRAGVDLRLGVAVEAVGPGPDVIADGRAHRFDQVVVTAAPPIAKDLVRGLTEEETLRLSRLTYQGIVCASLVTKKPLAGYYLTYLYEEAPFTGVIEMSALVDPGEFGGNTLVYLPKYCRPDDPLLQATDDEIRAAFLPALEEIYPSFDRSDVLAFRVSRVRNVFPIAQVGYSEMMPGFQSSIPGVHLVSSAHIVNSTLNVNDTLDLATRAGTHLRSVASRALT